MAEIGYINPENMVKPRGYSHAISVTGNHQAIYLGGQNAVDENGALVGKDSLRKQAEQVLINIEKILEESDAKLEHVVKFNIYLVQGQDPQEGFQVFQEKWGDNPNYPIITVLFVAGLGNQDWLVEIDAMAIIPE
ncbi:MAG: RidA family protein [Methanobacterium sp.]|uniref:RidA family protein n=1 Tax=Methanobacterium sp. TaxID=2164 RepID=UPI00258D14B1|nr:RidA family protein [Methanobacterium sp.]MCC7559319.1 RidA family protein [Methanobacterium sp.]